MAMPLFSSERGDLVEVGLAVTADGQSGDLDDVEAELGDLLYVFQAVGAPFVLPVGVVNAELHRFLRVQFLSNPPLELTAACPRPVGPD